MRPFISSSHCIILPSYREGLPRIILEAMSMARPVITTNVPGCRSTTIHGENGFLVPPRSIAALVDAMELFASLTQPKMQSLGRSGRLRAETLFGDVLIAQRLIEKIDL